MTKIAMVANMAREKELIVKRQLAFFLDLSVIPLTLHFCSLGCRGYNESSPYKTTGRDGLIGLHAPGVFTVYQAL